MWFPGIHGLGNITRLQYGQTQRSVAESVEVVRSVISKVWNQSQETGNVRRWLYQCRPRSTTATGNRYLTLTVSRNGTHNDTQRQFLLATQRRVSSQTIKIGFIRVASMHVGKGVHWFDLKIPFDPEKLGCWISRLDVYPGSPRRCYSVEIESEVLQIGYVVLCLLKNILYFAIFLTK